MEKVLAAQPDSKYEFDSWDHVVEGEARTPQVSSDSRWVLWHV